MNRNQNAILFRSTPSEPAPSPAETQALRAASLFEHVFREIQEHGSLSDRTLTRLVRESFAAGFAAAASGTAPLASPEPTDPAPSPTAASLADLVGTLTPRRLEVLQLVARGLTNREIARVLGISTNTVKAHLAGVLEALDLSNRTEAAVALREYEAERGPSGAPVRLLRSVAT